MRSLCWGGKETDLNPVRLNLKSAFPTATSSMSCSPSARKSGRGLRTGPIEQRRAQGSGTELSGCGPGDRATVSPCPTPALPRRQQTLPGTLHLRPSTTSPGQVTPGTKTLAMCRFSICRRCFAVREMRQCPANLTASTWRGRRPCMPFPLKLAWLVLLSPWDVARPGQAGLTEGSVSMMRGASVAQSSGAWTSLEKLFLLIPSWETIASVLPDSQVPAAEVFTGRPFGGKVKIPTSPAKRMLKLAGLLPNLQRWGREGGRVVWGQNVHQRQALDNSREPIRARRPARSPAQGAQGQSGLDFQKQAVAWRGACE